MASQSRAFALPAAHADVDVVALREHPAVTPGDRAELEDGASPIPVLADRLERHVALQRDGEHVVAAEPEPVANSSVDAVRADEHAALDTPAVDAQRDAGLPDLDVRHLHAVTDVRAGGDGLLEQMLVEADALRHLDQRPLAVPFEAHPVRRAESRCGRRRARPPRRRRPAARGRPASSARRRTACRAGSAPCRRRARALPRGPDGRRLPSPRARRRRRSRRSAPRSAHRSAHQQMRFGDRRPPSPDPQFPFAAASAPRGRYNSFDGLSTRDTRLDFVARGCARAAKGSGL